MNRITLIGNYRAQLVNGLADDVQNATQRRWPYRNRHRAVCIDSPHSPYQALSRLHSNTTAPSLTQVLLHLNRNANRFRDLEAIADDSERLINRGQLDLFELNVHNRPDHL